MFSIYRPLLILLVNCSYFLLFIPYSVKYYLFLGYKIFCNLTFKVCKNNFKDGKENKKYLKLFLKGSL